MSVKVMSEKKVQRQADKLSETGVVNFIGDIKAEFKKVSWTERDELRNYTKIVIGATFVFGLGVYFIDLLIQTCLTSLNFFLRFITG